MVKGCLLGGALLCALEGGGGGGRGRPAAAPPLLLLPPGVSPYCPCSWPAPGFSGLPSNESGACWLAGLLACCTHTPCWAHPHPPTPPSLPPHPYTHTLVLVQWPATSLAPPWPRSCCTSARCRPPWIPSPARRQRWVGAGMSAVDRQDCAVLKKGAAFHGWQARQGPKVGWGPRAGHRWSTI